MVSIQMSTSYQMRYLMEILSFKDENKIKSIKPKCVGLVVCIQNQSDPN